MYRLIALAAALFAGTGLFPASAKAQQFNQVIVFGDSNVDSGWYKYNSAGTGAGAVALNNQIAANPTAGAPTTNPGPMNSQVLAMYFGLTANPADAPGGGTNYAISGAKNVTVNNAATGGFGGAVPTVTQMTNYLAATGGRANGNALYLVNSGANDISYALGQTGTGPYPADPNAYLLGAASSLSQSIAQLKVLGARYFIVPDQAFSFPTGNAALNVSERAAKLLYTQSLWSDLAAAGINFIPADFNSVRVAIAANPSAFGFQFIGSGNTGATPNSNGQAACNTYNPAVTTAWALGCTAANLVAPDAMQTHLFADDQHLSTAGQKIEADYFYSLITAPSLISFLPENAVKTRTRMVSSVQNQIGVSQGSRGPSGVNAWVTGDLAALQMDNYPGFPGDPNHAATLTAGLDYQLAPGIVVGAVVSTGTLKAALGTLGNFRQNENGVSLYAAYNSGGFWGDAVGSYGRLDYDVNRVVPIGITTQANTGGTGGDNWSVAVEGGYKFKTAGLTHGPVIGLLAQRVTVDGFTEGGSFTSLGFGDQARNSAVGQFGYRASFKWGVFEPFAQATWSHEFDNTDRNVTASLTTIVAPSFSMPAVVLGKDWGTATLGTVVDTGNGVKVIGSVSGEFAQNSATTYGGQLGLNIGF